MARTVRDLALMLSVMAGPDPRAPLSIAEPGAPLAEAAAGSIDGWQVAWGGSLGGLLRLDDAVARVTETAARRFADLGCSVEDAGPDLGDAREIIPPVRTLRTAIVRQPQLERAGEITNQALKDYLARAEELTVLEVARAEFRRSQLVERAQRFFEMYRLLLLPTTQMAAFPKELGAPSTLGGQPIPDSLQPSLSTYAISITGLPAISIPCGFTPDGLPLGLQIVGGPRREADVLRAAAAFEAAFPWAQHRPPAVRPGAS
jgi:amidase